MTNIYYYYTRRPTLHTIIEDVSRHCYQTDKPFVRTLFSKPGRWRILGKYQPRSHHIIVHQRTVWRLTFTIHRERRCGLSAESRGAYLKWYLYLRQRNGSVASIFIGRIFWALHVTDIVMAVRPSRRGELLKLT